MASSDIQSGGLVREWKRRILNFTPSWFSVNMGTGIASILLYNLPYQFTGLKIVATVIFVLNIVLFIFFLFLSMWVVSIVCFDTSPWSLGSSHDWRRVRTCSLTRSIKQDADGLWHIAIACGTSYGPPYSKQCSFTLSSLYSWVHCRWVSGRSWTW